MSSNESLTTTEPAGIATDGQEIGAAANTNLNNEETFSLMKSYFDKVQIVEERPHVRI